MIKNADTPTDMTATNARRIAELRATPPIVMPSRPTDTSRNGRRTPRSPRRRIIR